MKSNKAFERAVHGIFLILGLVTVACVLLITVYLVISGIPAIMEIGLWDFLFGKVWEPAASNPQYGILPFILSSIYGTAGALVIGVPIGFFTAVYLSKKASKRVKEWMSAAVSGRLRMNELITPILRVDRFDDDQPRHLGGDESGPFPFSDFRAYPVVDLVSRRHRDRLSVFTGDDQQEGVNLLAAGLIHITGLPEVQESAFLDNLASAGIVSAVPVVKRHGLIAEPVIHRRANATKKHQPTPR